MAASVTTTVVSTPDGRELCIEEGGDPRGRPVLIHGGTPNSRHLYRLWLEDAEQRNIRLLSYDRPGYGRSTDHPGHSVADGATDVRTIAGELGIDSLLVWGLSGGGPYALACAALLPELVPAVAAVCSIAPYGAPGLDYFGDMGDANKEDIELYFTDREAARKKAIVDREEILATKPDEVSDGMQTLLSPLDAAELGGEFGRFLHDAMADGLATTEQGWWDDGAAHLEPWGFEFSSITVPVKVFHGRHDRFVPFSHGQWLAANVPGAETFLSDEDGHLTLIARKFPDVHEWLLSQG